MTAAVAWARARLRQFAPMEIAAPAPAAPRSFFWRRARKPATLVNDRIRPTRENSGTAWARAAMIEAANAVTPSPALMLLSQRLGLSLFEQHVLLLCV